MNFTRSPQQLPSPALSIVSTDDGGGNLRSRIPRYYQETDDRIEADATAAFRGAAALVGAGPLSLEP